MSTSAHAEQRTKESPSFEALRTLFTQKIGILDGAMGSMIQTYGLTEADQVMILNGKGVNGATFWRFTPEIMDAFEKHGKDTIITNINIGNPTTAPAAGIIPDVPAAAININPSRYDNCSDVQRQLV